MDFTTWYRSTSLSRLTRNPQPRPCFFRQDETSAAIIRTARGLIVNEAALVRSLQFGKVHWVWIWRVWGRGQTFPHSYSDHPCTVRLPYVKIMTVKAQTEMGSISWGIWRTIWKIWSSSLLDLTVGIGEWRVDGLCECKQAKIWRVLKWHPERCFAGHKPNMVDCRSTFLTKGESQSTSR